MLGSVPTMILFVLLVVAYGLLVRQPLDRVLAERRARTSGAVEQARGAISAAEAETAVYEDKLRAARKELFETRDRRLKAWAAEREAALAETRKATQAKVAAAREEIEQGTASARQEIEDAAGSLSSQILKAVLPSGVEIAQ